MTREGDMDAAHGLDWRGRVLEAETALRAVLLGQEEPIRMALLTVLCRGHALLAGDVGTGKTTLLRALARVIGGPYARIEGAADLLPSDLLYAARIDADGRPRVDPGPVLSQGEDLAVFFFNEINRARPQVHALLLRLMAERSLSAFQRDYVFPYVQVFADRNQIERDETFELPAAARDRFMMEIPVFAPASAEQRMALAFETRFHDTDSLIGGLPAGALPYRGLNDLARRIQDATHASPSLQRYVFGLCEALRDPAGAGLSLEEADVSRLVKGGVSPRGMQALVRASRAQAWTEGRDAVLPQDVRRVFTPVMAHRTFLTPAYEPRRDSIMPALIEAAFRRVPTPES